VTGEVAKWTNGSGGSGVLARPLSADQDRHAAQIDEDLRRPARHRVGGDRRAKHLNIPVGRCFRVFADYVNVIEFECRIAHHLPSCRDRRRSDHATMLRTERFYSCCDTESATHYVQIRMRNTRPGPILAGEYARQVTAAGEVEGGGGSARDFGVSWLSSACSHSQPTSDLSQK
jgi:hypothetical protein